MGLYDNGLHSLSARPRRRFERKTTRIGDDGWKKAWSSIHEQVMPIAEQIPIASAFVPIADTIHAKATGDNSRLDAKAKKKVAYEKKVVDDKKKEEAAKATAAKKTKTMWYVIGGVAGVGVLAVVALLVGDRR